MSQYRIATPEVIRNDVVRIIEVTTIAGGVAVSFALGALDAKDRFVERERRSPSFSDAMLSPEMLAAVESVRSLALDLIVQGGSVPAGAKEAIPEPIMDPEPEVV